MPVLNALRLPLQQLKMRSRLRTRLECENSAAARQLACSSQCLHELHPTQYWSFPWLEAPARGIHFKPLKLEVLARVLASDWPSDGPLQRRT